MTVHVLVARCSQHHVHKTILTTLEDSSPSSTHLFSYYPPPNKPQTTQTPDLNMAPGRKPQQPTPSQIPRINPQAYQTYNPFFDPHIKDFQRGVWLAKTRDHFHQLILWAERQPSNGSVRGVDRPDGETRFMVAYGNGPDRELKGLLVCFIFSIYQWNGMTDMV